MATERDFWNVKAFRAQLAIDFNESLIPRLARSMQWLVMKKGDSFS